MSTNDDALDVATTIDEIQSHLSYLREARANMLAEVEMVRVRAQACLDCLTSLELILDDATARAASKTANAGEPERKLEQSPAGKRERA